jgi:hypothetical protein
MAKNIPITARVSKGLFGQKATEPVLNVGQAGVYGNNVTKGDPSPAKIMMKSPLKQVKAPKSTGDLIIEAGQANAIIGSKGPDRVIKGETKVIPGKKYVPNENAWWDSLSPQQKAEHNKKTKEKIAKDPEYQPKTIQEPDKTVPGEDTTKKVPLRTYNEGSAKTSFWRRQDDRAVTHTSRKKKRADIQLAKLEAKQGYTTSMDKDGKEVKTAITDSSKHVKDARLNAKKEMWESRQAGYKGSREAAVLQSEQSTRVHDKILGVHVNRGKEEVLDISRAKVGEEGNYEMRTEMEAGVYKTPRARAAAGAVTNPATGKPAGGLAETKSTDVKAAEAPKKEEVSTVSAKDLEDDKPMVESVTKKSANSFFAKKSPLKMKYFK